MGAAQIMFSFVGLVFVVAIVVGVWAIVRSVKRNNAAGEIAASEAEKLRHEQAKARDLKTISDLSDAELAQQWHDVYDMDADDV